MSKQTKPVPPRSRLGRGLSSLIAASAAAEPDAATMTADHPASAASSGAEAVRARTLDIGIEQISPNPHQPRRQFDDSKLEELAASIRQQGVLQPLLVARADGDGAEHPFVLVAGERRLRAARQAGLDRVPCVVREATGRQMLEWSLIENIQRADLNAIERARAYRDYMDRFGLTQAEVAQRTGEARATVANHVRLLDLCDEVQQALVTGALTFGHARALAGLAGRPERQAALARRVGDGGLSVRQTERLVAAEQGGEGGGGEGSSRPRRPKAPYVVDLEGRLTGSVGTRVKILPGRGKNSGRIVIDYYSLDDFDRIAGMLGLESDG